MLIYLKSPIFLFVSTTGFRHGILDKHAKFAGHFLLRVIGNCCLRCKISRHTHQENCFVLTKLRAPFCERAGKAWFYFFFWKDAHRALCASLSLWRAVSFQWKKNKQGNLNFHPSLIRGRDFSTMRTYEARSTFFTHGYFFVPKRIPT